MATYVVLLNFTDEGIRAVKKSPDRAKALDAEAEKLGVNIKQRLWTMGAYDLVITADAPNDEALTTLMLSLGSRGMVRTHTLRAFSAHEINSMLAKL
jgi:uncharacterized protein with GYD domain